MALRNCSELSLSLRAAAAAVMMLAFAASALASDWTGAGDGLSWNDPGNWSDGVVPGPGDSVTVTDEFVQVTSAVSVLNLTLIRATISGNGNLTITGSLSMQSWLRCKWATLPA